MSSSTTIHFFLFLVLQFSVLACASSPESAKQKSKKSVKSSVDKEKSSKDKKITKSLPRSVDSQFLRSPLIKKIHQRQARRMGALSSLKKKGVIGESFDGTIKIRSSKSLSEKDKKIMEKLVTAENQDRLLVYQEMAKIQRWKQLDFMVLRRKMFDTYLELDPAGTWYYNNRTWLRK